MKLIPVALVIFYVRSAEGLMLWVQKREDDGPYHGLLEFPGGGIERGETPLEAAIREVQEEVGIIINAKDAQFFGTYANVFDTKSILLYIYLCPRVSELEGKGEWLKIEATKLGLPYSGLIPGPNHKIIDDLFHAFNDSYSSLGYLSSLEYE